MTTINPKIQYKTDIPPIKQYWELFLTAGWNDKYQTTPDGLTKAIKNSWHQVSAYNDKHLVGFGRILSDGVLYAMIYDLIVLPEYQEQGIGSTILGMLLDKCIQVGIPDIQLFCARGKRRFYEKRGFTARPDDAPGMQYQF
jgi:GNAT superfamily N-acetyltransferase